MLTYEEAFKRVCAAAKPVGCETTAFAKTTGRVVAEDVQARSDAPMHDVSAMDGYGLRSADLATLPARLPIVAESFAGSAPLPELSEGGCVRIFTGAPVPAGVERVVVQENVTREGDFACFETPPGEGRNIRRAGSDFRAGDTLLEKGTRLGWRAMTAAAAADQADLMVYCTPKAVILATGDELASPGRAHQTPGHIPESVSFGIAAFLTANGIKVLRSMRLADDPEALSKAAKSALQDADLIVVTGGASVGEKDYARSMFEGHDLEEIFTKVAIKPGKPVWMARADKAMIIGLPGNPSSALVTARLFLKPLVFGMTGRAPETANYMRELVCTDALAATKGREVFLRACLLDAKASLFSNQDSSAQATLTTADILIRRPAHAPALPAGSRVDVLDFS